MGRKGEQQKQQKLQKRQKRKQQEKMGERSKTEYGGEQKQEGSRGSNVINAESHPGGECNGEETSPVATSNNLKCLQCNGACVHAATSSAIGKSSATDESLNNVCCETRDTRNPNGPTDNENVEQSNDTQSNKTNCYSQIECHSSNISPSTYKHVHSDISPESYTSLGDDEQVTTPTTRHNSQEMVKVNITTFNIENFRSNNCYLLDLLKYSDIIAIQEHWLYKFEKQDLIDFCTKAGFRSVVQCSDEENPINPMCRPRGKGGVAFIWKNELDQYVEIQAESNNRIIVALLHKSVCIISCYLTARGSGEAENDFNDQLAEINELIVKYSPSYRVIIMGDLNASLHRQKMLRETGV